MIAAAMSVADCTLPSARPRPTKVFTSMLRLPLLAPRRTYQWNWPSPREYLKAYPESASIPVVIGVTDDQAAAPWPWTFAWMVLQSASAAALASKGRGCLIEEPVLMTTTSKMVVLSLLEPIPRLPRDDGRRQARRPNRGLGPEERAAGHL